MGLLPLNGNPSKCIDIDALRRSIRAEMLAIHNSSLRFIVSEAGVTPNSAQRRVIMAVASRMAGLLPSH
ncbi:hypothetical protein [Mesorhizobium sp. M0674]|uniref:hypothetical protein n=1 Tax=unclassified Mesorhizobium TaxID=325217 RepID=UPI00333B9519